MSYGPDVSFPIPVASFATSSASVDLGKAWSTGFLVIPSMTSNTECYVQGSSDNITFRRIYHPVPASASPTIVNFLITSGITNAIVPIPTGPRYIKIETSAVVSFSAAYVVICSD